MGNIGKEMMYQAEKSLFGNNIFLPAVMTVPSLHNRPAVQAIFFHPLRGMRHRENFLKNSHKTYIERFLFRYWINKVFLTKNNIQLMKNTIAALLLLASFSTKAQYYYKDIIGTAETNQLLKTYTANNVLSVSLKSFDADGTISENFSVQQSHIPSQRVLKTITISGVTDETILNTWYDETTRLLKTTDTTTSTINTAVYAYDGGGKITSIKSFSGDTLKSIQAEEHQWSYTAEGKPLQMLRIVNNKDSSLVKFKLDENGNVSEETIFKKGTAGDPVFYYYNDRNRLTDIVRYNYKLKKLLPDYMFEYSDAGQVIQKITVPSNKASEYLIWRYQYDSRGLKVKEACFTKDKQLTGKIEYSYRFG
jgi:hypothetical protein